MKENVMREYKLYNAGSLVSEFDTFPDLIRYVLTMKYNPKDYVVAKHNDNVISHTGDLNKFHDWEDGAMVRWALRHQRLMAFLERCNLNLDMVIVEAYLESIVRRYGHYICVLHWEWDYKRCVEEISQVFNEPYCDDDVHPEHKNVIVDIRKLLSPEINMRISFATDSDGSLIASIRNVQYQAWREFSYDILTTPGTLPAVALSITNMMYEGE